MINVQQEVQRIIQWVRERVAEAGAKGTVVGLSGGIDSAVVAGLCSRACPGQCLGVIMPCHSNPLDAVYARKVADRFGIPVETVVLDEVFDVLVSKLNPPPEAKLAVANIKPRLRMTTLYYYASLRNYLVAGTGNRSELVVGYFTKYGDGGVDILPIGHLVKTQVRELAKELGVPQEIIDRPPTAGLWENQTDEGEMGLTYAELDRFILTGEAAPHLRQKIEEMIQRSEHKRRLPQIPSL